jgi:hypothetical protein
MTEIYFPFNTCEEPNKKSWVAQPISAFINMITCLILIYFFLQAKTSIIRLLILSFILFEIFHTFSHITHIDGTIQSNIIHGIWYFLSFMVLIASIKITKQYPNIYTILILLTIIIIDINLFFQANKLYMVFTALTLPVVIVISYYNLYPICIKKAIPYLIALLIILGLVLINEKINCLNMMKYAKLPYHAIIEIIGMILFTLLSYIFLQTEKYNL